LGHSGNQLRRRRLGLAAELGAHRLGGRTGLAGKPARIRRLRRRRENAQGGQDATAMYNYAANSASASPNT
jgi:hypothetical protein